MACVEYEVSNAVATLTFNRPEALNALNGEILRVLSQRLMELSADTSVRVLRLKGAGGKAFVAGADIEEMKTMSALEAASFSALGQRTLLHLEHLPQITIAEVGGFALGGGCEVAMACDLIYASEKAKFGQPEVNLGVIPGFGGTQRLARLVGPMRAREIIYTGRMLRAEEACDMGLVARVFPPDRLETGVTEVVESILEKGPQAIRQAKNVLRDGMDLDLRKACALEREAFALCFASPQQQEGMGAFLQKRKPEWKE